MLNPFDFLFPSCCAVCSEPVTGKAVLCPACEKRLLLTEHAGALCPVCGKTAASCVCRHGNPFHFVRCISSYVYDDALRPVISSLKYHPKSGAVDFFAARIAQHVREEFAEGPFSFVTEVPMASVKRRERGHNQAASLAKAVAAELGVPYSSAPIRKEDTMEQHSLAGQQRRENAKSGFCLTEGARVRGAVLLIDDVMTTGSTLDRCAELLLECGAAAVFCATAATKLIRPRR